MYKLLFWLEVKEILLHVFVAGIVPCCWILCQWTRSGKSSGQFCVNFGFKKSTVLKQCG